MSWIICERMKKKMTLHGTRTTYLLLFGQMYYSEKTKGALQNPSKRFRRFPKVSKCFQSLKKRINNSTEPFEGSAFYPLAEPSLTEPFFRFCTAKKVPWENTKPWGFCTNSLTVGNKTLMVLQSSYIFFRVWCNFFNYSMKLYRRCSSIF